MKLTFWVCAAALLPFTLAAVPAERIDPLKGTADPCDRDLWYDGRLLLVEDSSVSNTTPTEKGTICRRIHEDLKAEGITGLHFLSNRDMLGTDGDGTVDGCHPNDIGMLRQATAFSKSLATILGIPTR
jgi:hypothetical protein